METATEHKAEVIVRAATSLDIHRLVKMVLRLHRFEAALGDNTCTDNEDILKADIAKNLSSALFDHDKKIAVIEKSGNIVALFILEVEDRSPVYRQQRVCNIWIGVAQKNPVYSKKLLSLCRDWAKEKKCQSIIARTGFQNGRVHELLRKVGFVETEKTFEIGV